MGWRGTYVAENCGIEVRMLILGLRTVGADLRGRARSECHLAGGSHLGRSCWWLRSLRWSCRCHRAGEVEC